jgi:hypothetical protein
MADREISSKLFTKHKRSKIKQHKLLRQDPQFRQQKGKTKKELERILEVQDAEEQIKEFTK